MQAIIRGMGNTFTSIIQRVMPDAYIFCLLLTFVAMLGAMFITGKSLFEVVDMWGNGFWGILVFSMQSSLALVGGYVLSSAPPFKKVLGMIAGLPRTHGQAIVLATLCSLGLWIFHWGVGAVATGIICLEIARQAAKKGIKLHYPLLVAGSYVGTVAWHNGISGASQLLIATENHFLAEKIGIIPISQTIFSSGNLMIAIALIILTPILTYMMIPEEKDYVSPATDQLGEFSTGEENFDAGQKGTLAYFLNNSPLVPILITLVGVTFLYHWFYKWNGAFDINTFIVIMLMASIILHWRMSSYIKCLKHAVKTAIPIMLQFQFYGGILGILVASGLVAVIANFFVAISTPLTFPVLAFIGAGIVNFFVPSGGGQWIVQGSIIVESAQQLGVSIPRAVTAFANGDAWTNLLQPFWTLPLLAFAGLKIRDIMGYCAVILVFSFIVIALGLMFAPFPG
ncbi:short-chain fatty acid transporter [Desulforamulus aquiferis]|uniref:TIGR00366 family protein n=1 Tax=Desulforamulus aquiferis TaxID=1397668 RepID=A0AAW7Z999_9FIRM|nr:TIGR00366 family protein [Desulforamulus aquiferis]MDO7785699.1 TIGR00366 family protein [Desulforamulus aquiferis]